MSYSTYFKKLREEKGLAQNRFAEAIHASYSTVRNIEKERSSSLQFETFLNLVEYTGKPMEQVAYEVFFSPEDRYDHPIRSLSKHYLASRYCRRCVISPAHSVEKTDGRKIDSQGAFWIAGSPYYRVLIEGIRKNRYLSAIRSDNRTEKLMKLVFSETLPYEGISSQEYIRELRFVLDARSDDHRAIFSELKKITIANLGNSFHISYVLYDPDKDRNGIDPEKHYITIKKFSPDI